MDMKLTDGQVIGATTMRNIMEKNAHWVTYEGRHNAATVTDIEDGDTFVVMIGNHGTQIHLESDEVRFYVVLEKKPEWAEVEKVLGRGAIPPSLVATVEI